MNVRHWDAIGPKSAKLSILTDPSGKRATISNSPPMASMWLRKVERYMSVREDQKTS
jgi:hypothetical protein